MGAFKGAVEVGAHALETDVHLSADGIVVLSHVSLHCHQPLLNSRLHLLMAVTDFSRTPR